MHNVAAGLLANHLASRPDRAAYLCGDDVLSFSALAAAAARFANLLRARGVAAGDRVVVSLPDSLAYPTALLGTMLLGAAPVPVNAELSPADQAFILADSGARALVSWEDSPAMLAARDVAGLGAVLPCGPRGPWGLSDFPAAFEAQSPPSDAPGLMLYSSGSTGRPKGVPHAAEDLLRPAEHWGARVLGVGAADLIFSASKMSFAYGLIASFCLPLSLGAPALLLSAKPGPYEIFEAIARHRPSLFFGVPTLYSHMLRAYEPGDPDMDLSSLRLCYSAGEALPANLCRQWPAATGVEILDGIGSTEALNLFISNRPGAARCGTSGEVMPGFTARLVASGAGPEAPEVPEGEPGDLYIKGPGLARAYWNRPDKTAATMLPGGWLATGDVYARQDGIYTHQGRSDDMLKVGAHWVSPLAVEEALRSHAAVAECAVAALGVEGLMRPCAHVVPRPGCEPGHALSRELLRHARERLAPHMCPVRVEFHQSLPKTPTGKVQRFRLRQA